MADVNLTGDASSLVRALEQAARAFAQFDAAAGRISRNQQAVARATEQNVQILRQLGEATQTAAQRLQQYQTNVQRQNAALTSAASVTNLFANATRQGAAAVQLLVTEEERLAAENERLAKSAGRVATAQTQQATAQTELLAAQRASSTVTSTNVAALEAEAAALQAKVVITQEAIASETNRGRIGPRNVRLAREQAEADVAAAAAVAARAEAEGAAVAASAQRAATQNALLLSLREQVAAGTLAADAAIAQATAEGNLTAALQLQADARIAAARGAAAQRSGQAINTVRAEAAEQDRLNRVLGEQRARREALANAAGFVRTATQTIITSLRQETTAVDFAALAEGQLERRIRLTNAARQIRINTRITNLTQEAAAANAAAAAEERLLRLQRAARSVRRGAAPGRGVTTGGGPSVPSAGARAPAGGGGGGAAAIQQQQLLGAQVQRNVGLFGNLFRSIEDLGRLVGISLIIGGAFQLVGAISEAVTAAGELSVAIAEIETITKNANFSTEEWAEGLRTLSAEFGLDTLDQAEAAYQVLSNQIRNAAGEAIQGAEALRFLDAANKLAITGVTDTASATNLLTATLNSFRIPAEDAELVAAQLFKTVELGRLRIEELSQSFGRIAVPANQLGVELEELLGAIAQTTIQGVKFNEASTLIRNVILKLLRPTDTLKQVFADLGVASGEALIEQRGFIGALQEIESAVGGTSTELGEAFGRIRAITGALIFAGDGADRAAASIAEIRATTVQAFGADTQRVIQSTGKQLDIAAQTAKNFFEREIGTPALRSVAAIIKGLGDLDRVLATVVATIKILGTVILGVLVARAIPALILSINSVVASLATLNTVAALNPIVAILTAAAAAAVAFNVVVNDAVDAQRRIVEQANLAAVKEQEKGANQANAIVGAQTKVIQNEFRIRTRSLLQELGVRRNVLNQLADLEEGRAEDTTRRLKVATADFTSNLGSALSAQKKLFTDASEDVENVGKEIRKTFESITQQRVEVDLIGAGVGQQVQVLETAIARAQLRADQAADEGNLKNFQTASKRVDELSQLRIDAAIKTSREEIRLSQESLDARVRLQRAVTRQDRERATQRIQDIERQQRLLQRGTAEQLEAEQELQALQERFESARTEQDFREAFQAFAKIRREQEAVEESVRREQALREQAVRDEEKRVSQLEQIRQKNEQEAEAARQRENRLKVIQFLFEAISKDANAFNQEQVLAIKDQDTLLESVAEQQVRLGKLIELQREVGGGAEAEALTRARSASLQRSTQIELEKRANDAQQEQVTQQRELFDAQIKGANELRKTNVQALQAFESNLAQLQTASNELVKFIDAPPDTVAAGLGASRLREAGGRETAVELSTNSQRLRELSEQLRAAPGEFTEAQVVQFQNLLEKFIKSLTDRAAAAQILAATRGQTSGVPGVAGAPDQPAAFGEAILRLIDRQGDQPIGEIGKVLERDRVAAQQIEGLRVQTRQLEGFLTVKEREIQSTQDAIKSLTTFQERIDAAFKTARTVEEIGRTFPEVAEAPGLVEADLTTLTRDTEDAFKEGATNAAPDVAKAIADGTSDGLVNGIRQARADQETQIKSLAKIQAEETARTLQEEQLRRGPQIAEKLAQLRAQAEQRQALTTPVRLSEREPEFQRRQIDTSILLGRGAPSIGEQQARIQGELNTEIEREIAFRREQRKFEDQQRAVARQQALDAGELFVNAAGQLISRGAGQIRDGQLVAQRTPALDEAIKQTTVQEQMVAEQKRTNAILAGEEAAPTARPTAPTAPTVLSPTQFDETSVGRGQEEALEALRLARGGAERLAQVNQAIVDAKQQELEEVRLNLATAVILGASSEEAVRIANDRNNITQQARDETLAAQRTAGEVIDQAALGAPGFPRGAPREEFLAGLETPITEIARSADQFAKITTSVDGLTAAIDQFTVQVRQPQGFAAGGPVSGPGGTDNVPAMLTAGEFVMNRKSTSQFFPQLLAMNSGRLQPRGFQDGGPVTDVGGIRVTVNESSSPQATARQVVAEINRGIRQGTMKLRRS